MFKRLSVNVVFVLLLGVLAACNMPQATGNTDGEIDAAASVTAAVMTVVAGASPTPVPSPSNLTPEPAVTPTPPVPTATRESVSPTDTPTPPAATATSVPPAEAPVCRAVQNLNLRIGPGVSYDPPIRSLPPDTSLVPLAFSALGFPGGQWVQVRDDATGDEGWVSAAAQFVSCTIDVTTLPQADFIPPTPTPLPQPTATIAPVAGGPPRVNNSAPGGTSAKYAEGEVIVNDYFLFQMRVLDTRFGQEDGSGIDHVEFFVSTENGDQIYSRRENHAGYCIFGGGEPDCNTWPQRDGRFVWGGDGLEVQPGKYFISILVTPKEQDFEGETWNWDFDFNVSLP